MNRISTRNNVIVAMAVLVALGLSAAPAAADHPNNKGTIKIHDEMDADPDMRNEPHVSCDFWVEGFNMEGSSGHLEFYEWAPTGNGDAVTPGGDTLTWTGEAEDDRNGGYHFLKGPYFLPAGHYRVEAYDNDGHPGSEDHFVKTKTFWVDECAPCPDDLSVTANDDGSVTLEWEDVDEAEGYNVYRAAGDGPFVFLDDTTDTTYTDSTTANGVTYHYRVTSTNGDFESEDCDDVTVTAVPFFPGLAVGALALVGSVGAYAALRRRV